MSFKYNDLMVKQNYSLQEKIEYTKTVIEEFVKHFDNKIYVSFSGGIDSTVLLHIVRSMYPDTLAVFCNTTNEYPELVKFVKSVPNVKTLLPVMNFKQVVLKYGFPFVSKKVSRAITDLRNPHAENPNIRNLYLNGKNRKGHLVPSYKLAKKWYYLFDKEITPFSITSSCCDILKKDPIKKFNKESGLFAITGTLASESTMRKNSYLKYGDNIIDSKEPKSRPLSIWTDKDIWAYIKNNDVSYCELYDDKILEDGTVISAETTTGCVACGMGCHLESKSRFESSELRRPRLFKNIMRLKNNDTTYEDALKHYMNPSKDVITKEYQQKAYLQGMEDLKGCDVVCNR